MYLMVYQENSQAKTDGFPVIRVLLLPRFSVVLAAQKIRRSLEFKASLGIES